VRNLAADADVTLEDRSGTSSSTSRRLTASRHRRTLSGLASSMAYLTICQPLWRLHHYHDRDVVSDRCAADHAAMGTASPPVKVLVSLVLGFAGFGPRHTSSPTDDPSLSEL